MEPIQTTTHHTRPHSPKARYEGAKGSQQQHTERLDADYNNNTYWMNKHNMTCTHSRMLLWPIKIGETIIVVCTRVNFSPAARKKSEFQFSSRQAQARVWTCACVTFWAVPESDIFAGNVIVGWMRSLQPSLRHFNFHIPLELHYYLSQECSWIQRLFFLYPTQKKCSITIGNLWINGKVKGPENLHIANLSHLVYILT